jgi:hypothetical protein
MEGSQTVIKRLSETYEVFVTSAATDYPNSFPARYIWLKKHFPFIPDKDTVFCWDKSIIRADFKIYFHVRSHCCARIDAISSAKRHKTSWVGFPRLSRERYRYATAHQERAAESKSTSVYRTRGHNRQDDTCTTRSAKEGAKLTDFIVRLHNM